MTKLVLLTGATGFVGRQILTSLGELGYLVRVIARPGSESFFLNFSNIERICLTSDLFNETEGWFKKVLEGIDLVVHSAWYAEPGKYLDSPLNEICSKGTLIFAKVCKESGVRRFIGLGTCFEYDLQDKDLSVEAPLKPISLYARSKVETFYKLCELFDAENTEFVWCRIFYLYGEGEDSRRLVPYINERLRCGEVAEIGNPHAIRDFLDVKVAGRMIAEIATNSSSGVFNICSGVPVTLREFCESIASNYGRTDLLKFGSEPFNQSMPRRVVGVRNYTLNS